MARTRAEYQKHINALCKRCGQKRIWHGMWSPRERREKCCDEFVE